MDRNGAAEQIILSRALRPGALEAPRGIFVNESVTWQPRWLWIMLWNLAGRRAGTVVTTKRDLAALIGRNELRRIGHYIEALEAAGVVELRPEPKGNLRIYVHDPDLCDPLYAVGRRADGPFLFDKFFPLDEPLTMKLPGPRLANSSNSPDDGTAFSTAKTPTDARDTNGKNAVPKLSLASDDRSDPEAAQSLRLEKGRSVPAFLPAKTPARNSLLEDGGGDHKEPRERTSPLRGEGAQIAFLIPPPPSAAGLTPKILEGELASLGIALSKPAVAAAIDAGMTLSEIAWSIEFFKANEGAWSPGALCHRFTEIARPGLRAEQCWPKPDEKWRLARSQQDREARREQKARQATQAKCRADEDSQLAAAREAAFGHTLDVMTDERAAELLERCPGVNDFHRASFRRGFQKGGIARELLLEAIEARHQVDNENSAIPNLPR